MTVTKLENALVTSSYPQALELAAYLKARKVDAKIVTRFGVQVHPAYVKQAEEAMKGYASDWRGDGRHQAASQVQGEA